MYLSWLAHVNQNTAVLSGQSEWRNELIYFFTYHRIWFILTMFVFAIQSICFFSFILSLTYFVFRIFKLKLFCSITFKEYENRFYDYLLFINLPSAWRRFATTEKKNIELLGLYYPCFVLLIQPKSDMIYFLFL